MAPSTKENNGKELAEEVSDTASNVGEPTQGEMLLGMQKMMKEISLHRTEMEAQRKADSERQYEQGSSRQTRSISSRHTKSIHSLQTQPTSSRKTAATSSFTHPEESNKTRGKSMTDKLTKFKKFAPPIFKEAKTQLKQKNG